MGFALLVHELRAIFDVNIDLQITFKVGVTGGPQVLVSRPCTSSLPFEEIARLVQITGKGLQLSTCATLELAG